MGYSKAKKLKDPLQTVEKFSQNETKFFAKNGKKGLLG
jgi:hypothetical protein